MFLKNIDFKIIEILAKGNINLKKLSLKLDMSVRNTRYRISKINEYLKKEKISLICKNEHNEYYLKISESELEKIIGKFDFNYYIPSETERIDYILSKILFSGICSVEMLSKELDISIATVNRDMRKVKALFSSKFLFIEKNGKNFVIYGKEYDIRKFYVEILMKYMTNTNKFLEEGCIFFIKTSDIAAKFLKSEGLKNIRTFISILQNSLTLTMSDEAYNFLLYYIYITIIRLKHNNYLIQEDNINFLENTIEYSIIIENRKYIEKAYSVKFTSHEIIKLTEILAGSYSYEPGVSFIENWIEVEKLIKKLILRVSKNYNADFLNDAELEKSLLNHIRPTIYRIKNKIQWNISIYNEFIKNDPELFKAVEKGMLCFKKFLGTEINKEEITFIAVHFKNSINKHFESGIKKALIICGYGYGTSQLLKEEIERYYNIQITDVIPFYKFMEYETFSADLIISTIDILEIKSNIPFIKVNPILNDYDKKKLESFGIKKLGTNKIPAEEIVNIAEKCAEAFDKDKMYRLLKSKFENNFNFPEKIHETSLLKLLKNNITISSKETDWKNILNTITAPLIKEKYIDSEYRNEIIELINLYGSYMVINDGVALLHGKIGKNVRESVISICVSKKDIIFADESRCNLLILIAVKSKDEAVEVMTDINKIVRNKEILKKIKSSSSAEEMQNYLACYLN